MRRVLLAGSVLLVVWAALVVPMPYEQTVPGTARPVEELVSLGATDAEINGDLSLLTVRDRGATPVDVVVAALREGEQLRPIAETLPPGIDDATMREILAQQFANSFTTAVGLAAQRAGFDVELSTEVVTTQVLEDGPSDGTLETGDMIRAIDGIDVDSGTELREQLAASGDGDGVTLTLERDGATIERTVTLGVLEATGEPGLGIIPSTLTAPVELPFDVQIEDANIVGPSAGLMIAVTVTDLLSDEDLARGRVITGTGSIDGSGAVGPIGGVVQKVEAAVDAGASLMLVPAEQAEAAIEASQGRVEVVGVADLDEALAAIRR